MHYQWHSIHSPSWRRAPGIRDFRVVLSDDLVRSGGVVLARTRFCRSTAHNRSRRLVTMSPTLTSPSPHVTAMRILHLETGRHLYGGAQQVVWLLRGLAERGVDNLLACPLGSGVATAAAPYAEIHPMPMGGDLARALVTRLLRLIRRTRPQLLHLHSRAGADLLGGLAGNLVILPLLLWLVCWRERRDEA